MIGEHEIGHVIICVLMALCCLVACVCLPRFKGLSRGEDAGPLASECKHLVFFTEGHTSKGRAGVLLCSPEGQWARSDVGHVLCHCLFAGAETALILELSRPCV